ncbi:MAG: hypothetical protein HY438_00935 [DPANN group archaeon]|nr:hypothetical protein [DPANN group archaeon]
MYTWGDDISTWKRPGSYDYGSAKRAYVDPTKPASPRSYSRRVDGPDMGVVDPKKDISSDSKNPVIVGIDCTGSMQEWPAEIFDRLPLFCQTLAKYKPDVEIAFAVIGDANSDEYPLQVAKFGKGTELDTILKSFYPEGGGGGQHFESYELFAHYVQNHVKTPNAVSPFLLVMGDEGFYKQVDPAQARHYMGDNLQGPEDSAGIWKSLTQKYDTYLLHKEYENAALDTEITEQWSGVLGGQKVLRVPSKERAVDVALGLIAKKWGNYSDFTKNMGSRHGSGTVASVLDSIRGVPAPGSSLDSALLGSKSGRDSKRLA